MLVFGHDLDSMCLSNLNKLNYFFQKSAFSLFVYVNFPLKFHFLNAYSEKTKSVTPIFYNRFRCISLMTTTMEKLKQIWIYAIWYRPTLRDTGTLSNVSIECHSDNQNQPFSNKMAKDRALMKLKEALPSTSSQRIAIIQHY